MNYDHTQKAPLHYILQAIGVAQIAGAWLLRDKWPAPIVLCVIGVMMFLFAMMFAHLTVRDEGEFMAIRYGPLPIFRRRIRYSAINSVEPSRSSLVDGWGIHWVPGRGWTYNLWGWKCVKLNVDGHTVRIGSDDADNLAAFLEDRIR